MTKAAQFRTVTRLSIYVDVADQIRRAILERALPSGEGLPPERELARQFGVSRATVREALRHLQAQGLLAPRGRTSPMQPAGPEAAVARFCEALNNVVQLRDVPLPDLVELRIAVEAAALARAAVAPVAARVDEARAALAIMGRSETSIEAFEDADVAFHVALVAASGNQALLLVMLAVKDSIRRHLGHALRDRTLPRLRARILDEHRGLLRAVERGQPKVAAGRLRAHLTTFYGS